MEFIKTKSLQERSQNLKEVPQNFMKVFNVNDAAANDLIQKLKKKIAKEKKKTRVPKLIIDDKLAS